MPFFTTNDECKLHYEDVGSGKPLVLIHGWAQSAAIFRRNIPEFSKYYRVISVDVRGHGESGKPAYGYRLSRFAKDIYELMNYLNLKDVNLLGWSMGCSIIWSYWDLFRSERLSKLILVDEPAWLMKTEDYDIGASTFDELIAMCNNIKKDQLGFTKQFIDETLTIKDSEKDENYPKELKSIIDENLKIPAEYSSRLAFIHWLIDWRDIMPTITIPTLLISGRKSFINWRSVVWNKERIPNSKLEFFEDRGHFMFFEDAEKFNKIVRQFIDS
ncbi:alpha/beta fold hydrolase [Clostridium sp. LBM24168]